MQMNEMEVYVRLLFQPRVLRKCIKTCLKKYEGLAEDECVKRFCFLLKNVWNWEQEIFTCNLGVCFDIFF